MLGKWVNGRLVQPSTNEKKKIVITNPTDDILKYIMGYKDMLIAPEPEYNAETQYIVMVLEKETDTEIHLNWEVREIEDNPISMK